MPEKPALLAIVGPTASGKTDVSLALARALSGDILCMDAMQVYRGMDIGTAKPTAAERAVAPHRLLDICDPRDAFSVAEYAARAREVIADAHAAGRLPILVGGTGLYLRAVTEGLSLGGAPPSPEIRARLEAFAREHGALALHDRLAAVDPVSAARLPVNDTRRVVRALEVFEQTGKPFSKQQPVRPPCPYALKVLGIARPRPALCARIDARVEAMMARGLLREVAALLDAGVPPDAQAMQGIGYKELVPVLRDGAPLPDAVARIQLATRQYAKRQMTWFRADKRVQWLDAEADGLIEQAMALCGRWDAEDG